MNDVATDAGGRPAFSLQQLLKVMVEKGASDLHITAGQAPLLRIDGAIIPLKLPQLTPSQSKALAYEVLSEEQKIKFEKNNELDFAFGMKRVARFRGNLFVQRGAVAAAFRFIPYQVMTFEELGLPPILAEISSKVKGLILVTGATGSGKSTTQAAMIDKINSELRVHIMTIEDPIEYVHVHKRSIINQREVGADTHSFPIALKHVLRQDPDVVLVGEMRDLETVESALTIAETGHLVMATLHTNSCVQSINRIIDVFPSHQQPQVRSQLSLTLSAVVTQQLLPNAQGPGRCLALEVMIPNAAIRNLIRENKLHQIYSQMQVGQEGSGMQTMNQALYDLYTRGMISGDDTFAHSNDPDELRAMIEGRTPQGDAQKKGYR
ncbi:MAG: type IV pili twitching motility protein PilT [Deltaproteobacteria bacterium]|nr:MAG: type IV pili twitching motility protein PilT [Deltaproteobacteria bacterium]